MPSARPCDRPTGFELWYSRRIRRAPDPMAFTMWGCVPGWILTPRGVLLYVWCGWEPTLVENIGPRINVNDRC